MGARCRTCTAAERRGFDGGLRVVEELPQAERLGKRSKTSLKLLDRIQNGVMCSPLCSLGVTSGYWALTYLCRTTPARSESPISTQPAFFSLRSETKAGGVPCVSLRYR